MERLRLPFSGERPFTRDEDLRRISFHLVRILRLWDAIEGKERNIVDFDLVPREEPKEESTEPSYDEFLGAIEAPSISSREAILAALGTIQFGLERIPVPRNSQEALQLDFLKAKNRAHIIYLRKRQGESIDGGTYIESTIGVKPELILESVLQKQQEKMASYFAELGCPEYTKDGIAGFRREQELPKNSIGGHLAHNADVYLRALSLFLGRECKPKFSIEIVEEDDYWMFWVNGTRKKFRARANVHERHTGKWTRGKTEDMASHELPGHLAQMDSWQKAIDKGELNPVLGLTSVHGPEQVTVEGIAQTLPFYVPGIRESFSPFGWLELELTGLRNMVYNNIHVWAIQKDVAGLSEGEREDFVREMISYMHQYYPAEPEEEIRKQVRDRTTHPWKQVYLYVYGIGFVRHLQYAEALSDEGKKKLLLFIYSQPTTPQQEDDFVRQLLNDPRKRYSAAKFS